MKHKRLKLIAVLLLVLGLTGLQAQTSVDVTGGNASGSGGSVSYSVGQFVYTTNIGTNDYVIEGVQQPFEISVVTGIEEAKGINLSVSAYPNPATNYLTVKVENYETANLRYLVFDLNGKLLQEVKCAGSETNINIQDYPASNYFVKVIDNKKEIKTFKVIKK